jgi:methionine-gamma-lyase
MARLYVDLLHRAETWLEQTGDRTMKRSKNEMKPETLAIHAGMPANEHGGVSVPIYQSATFSFSEADQGAARFAGTEAGYIYTRLGNPTVNALEEAVCTLEEGHAALGTSAGMAAISTVLLTILRSGDHVVATDAVYGATRVLLEQQLSKFGIDTSWVPSENLSAVRDAVQPNTRVLFIETPANPTMKLTDIEGCAEIVRDVQAVLVVDNTFASPLLQQPFRLGADVVVHSLTKYLNGHSDVVGGMIVSGTQELHERFTAMLRGLGGTMDPHQAWLVLRGLRTAALRVEKAQQNAERLAQWLESHPRVAWVSYPGLKSHPQHELMLRQMKGPGAMISFGVRGGLEAAKTTINAVRLATLAVSLGGVESLIEHPASMTHAGIPKSERLAAGIRDDLIRLSVGCEAYEDLQADLENALAAAKVPALS